MNGLTVLHPLFVSLLPLAAVPLVFHLLFRLKKKPKTYPSLMFFRRIDPKLNARRRLREWLILLLRVLLIALLLLALAHPRLLGKGREGTIAFVLVVDNSGSMSGLGHGAKPKLQEAVAGAHALVARLREKDSAGLVLLVDDPAVLLPNSLISDGAALSRTLDSISPTEASGTPARALERAMGLLESSSATQYAIHIFSDLQETEWNQAPLNLRVPRQGTSISIHRITTPPASKPNVSMMGLKLPDQKLLAGRRVPVKVQLSNPSVWEAKVQLNCTDDAGHRNLQDVSVPAHGEKTMTLSLDPPEPGMHWANVWVQGDCFEADNRASLAFRCDEKRPVLFLGKSTDFGLLPMALSPSPDGRLSGLVPVFSEFQGLIQALEQRKPVCAVATAEDLLGEAPNLALALKRFVEAGHDLLIVPAALQNSASAPPPDWLGIRLDRGQTNQSGLPIIPLDKSADVFHDLRDERGEVTLRMMKAFQFRPLQGQQTALLGLEDGRVLLAERRLGNGRVFVSGLAFDPAWSTLPLKAGFLALAQNMALVGAETGAAPLAVVAGEPLTFLGNTSAPIHVQSITGSPLDWKGSGLDLFGLPRSGLFTIQAAAQETHVAVRSADKEGNDRFLSGDRVPALGNLPYKVKTLTRPEELSLESGQPERSLDLALPFLLAAILACLGESWFANPPPVKKRAAGLASEPQSARSRDVSVAP